MALTVGCLLFLMQLCCKCFVRCWQLVSCATCVWCVCVWMQLCAWSCVLFLVHCQEKVYVCQCLSYTIKQRVSTGPSTSMGLSHIIGTDCVHEAVFCFCWPAVSCECPFLLLTYKSSISRYYSCTMHPPPHGRVRQDFRSKLEDNENF